MNIELDKKISIIVPVYNEASTIDELIDSLKQFKDYCEIIFVDGGSTDGTNRIIEGKHRLVYSPKKGRSFQMNYGASLSKGDILLFLHADSFLPSDALNQIQKIIFQGYKVGCFKIKFDSRNILMKICGFMSNLRVRLRNIAFGDQGIFIIEVISMNGRICRDTSYGGLSIVNGYVLMVKNSSSRTKKDFRKKI